MQRQTSLRLTAIVALAGLTACSGGGSSSTSPTPQTPPGPGGGASALSETTTMVLGGSTTTHSFSAMDGILQTVSFMEQREQTPVMVQIRASTKPPNGFSMDTAHRAPASGELTLLYYDVFTSPVDVTFNPLPGFTFTLPNSVPTTGQFYYGISPFPTSPSSGSATPNPGYPTPPPYIGLTLRTEGPVTAIGQTLTFAPSYNPLTLVAGNSYLFVFYRTCTLVSGATSC